MKKLILLLVALAAMLSGCGLVDTQADRHRRFRQMSNLHARMIVDEWDYIWLCDHSSNMTQWHPRVGI